uniref:G-protein coupled receptors family 1 profile domain-containing protein n=1 Tax=Eptatretus burgeri TaxID=7764 RepID=A0A8C4N876_EPTBU
MNGTFNDAMFCLVALYSVLALAPVIVSLNVMVVAGCALCHFEKPMLLYISLTAITDVLWLVLWMTFVISGLLAGPRQVSFSECLAQSSFMGFVNITLVLLIWIISTDRHCAIFWPYVYTSWAARRTLALYSASFLLLISLLITAPEFIMAQKLSFCSSEVVIPDAFCSIGLIAKAACRGIIPPKVYAIFIFSFICTLTTTTVCYSTFQIVRVCRKSSSTEFRNKALHLCCTQIMVFTVKFCSILIFAIMNRVDAQHSILRFFLYVVLTVASPTADPLIYGLRIKEIREPLTRAYRHSLWGTSFKTKINQIKIKYINI